MCSQPSPESRIREVNAGQPGAVELVANALGHDVASEEDASIHSRRVRADTRGAIVAALSAIKRLVTVDQKADRRTPRSNLATYNRTLRPRAQALPATKQRGRDATTRGGSPSTREGPLQELRG